jgi:hypothetical protein
MMLHMSRGPGGAVEYRLLPKDETSGTSSAMPPAAAARQQQQQQLLLPNDRMRGRRVVLPPVPRVAAGVHLLSFRRWTDIHGDQLEDILQELQECVMLYKEPDMHIRTSMPELLRALCHFVYRTSANREKRVRWLYEEDSS